MFKVSSPKKKKCSNGRLGRLEIDVLKRSEAHVRLNKRTSHVYGRLYSQETSTHGLTPGRGRGLSAETRGLRFRAGPTGRPGK